MKTNYYKLRYEVLKRDNFTCQLCGRQAPEVKLEVDHIIPKSAGGTDDPNNLRAVCYSCNRGKGSILAISGFPSRGNSADSSIELVVYELLLKWGGLTIFDLKNITGLSSSRLKGICHNLWEKNLAYKVEAFGDYQWVAVDPETSRKSTRT